MKKTRLILFPVIAVLLVFTLVTYTACKNDPCKGIACQNGGTCDNGSCNCPDGFEGPLCADKVDPCTKLNCLNGGTCVDGSCKCDFAYKGDSCEKKVREDYYKTYQGNGIDTDGDTYTGFLLKFYQGTGDAKTLTLDISDSAFNDVFTVNCRLEAATSYNVEPKIAYGVLYTGTGTVTEHTASLKLKVTSDTDTFTINFTDMIAL